MNARVLFCAVLALLGMSWNGQAQTLLAVDFNLRTSAVEITQPGFQPFLINSNGGTGNQTGPSTRTFGDYTVTVANSGTPIYTDRLRGAPTDSGAFTYGALLRDFIFCNDASGNNGIDLTVNGLTPNTEYRFTVWSFDASSAGSRKSDWSANGIVATNGYTFDGRVLPATSFDYRFSFLATADAFGTVLVTARRNSGSVRETGVNDVGVFLNGFTIETTAIQPATITADPVGAELFAGDNAVFTVGSEGTPPLYFQWLKNETNVIEGATSAVYTATNLTEAASYSVIVSNSANALTSAPAAVVVHPVTNLNSGLLVYWPLNDVIDRTEDVSANQYFLWATNMDVPNIVTGQRANALQFNGVDEFLTRASQPGDPMPAAVHPAYTVTMWVKGNGTNQPDKRVFSESSTALGSVNNSLWTIGTDNGGTNGVVDIYIRNSNGSNPINHRKTSLVAFDDTWHHIAWVDNNGIATVYVDGVPDPVSFNYTRGPIVPDIATIGAVYRDLSDPPSTAFFTGAIDDMAVWRRALTSNEVAYVMANGAVLTRPQFTKITVVANVVTLSFSSANPTGTHLIEQTTDVGGDPIDWDPVTATFTVDGNIVTAQFPKPANPQAFYRVSQ